MHYSCYIQYNSIRIINVFRIIETRWLASCLAALQAYA